MERPAVNLRKLERALNEILHGVPQDSIRSCINMQVNVQEMLFDTDVVIHDIKCLNNYQLWHQLNKVWNQKILRQWRATVSPILHMVYTYFFRCQIDAYSGNAMTGNADAGGVR